MLTNLVSNAVKFGAGKPIEVAVAPDGADTACLRVRDHGVGIPPDRLPRIFERFQQGAGQRAHGGLGLGLHIARSIVELHGGTIEVTSAPEEGTTFTVRLPLAGRAPG